jgi:UDP-N-acetylmuramyl tripeptide synthase
MLKLIDSNGEQDICDLAKVSWTLGAKYLPSCLNVMYSVAAIYGALDGNLPKSFGTTVEKTKLDPDGGRMTVLKAGSGTMVIADFAHEAVSIEYIGELARSLADERGGKSIIVTRIGADRSQEIIDEFGRAAGENFDEVVIYDRLDGYLHTAVKSDNPDFQPVDGETSTKLLKAVSTVNRNATRILREDKAIEYAARIADENDVVVVIVNYPKESLKYIKENFHAKST